MTSVLAAVGAAVLFGLGTHYQHRAAQDFHPDGVGILALGWRLVRNRRWLVGKAGDTAAVALQAVALVHGSLLGVQAIVASGIVVAVVASAVTDRRLPSAPEMVGSLAVVAGATVLAVVAEPEPMSHAPSWTRWLVATAGLAALVSLTVVGASRGTTQRQRHRAAALFGGSAGLCFAVGSAYLKGASWAVKHDGPLGALAGLAGFFLVGLVGNLLAGRAFQLGDLASGLAALTAVEPVAALGLGAVVFGEEFRGRAQASAGLGGLGLLLVGVVVVIVAGPRTRRGRAAPAPHSAPQPLHNA